MWPKRALVPRRRFVSFSYHNADRSSRGERLGWSTREWTYPLYYLDGPCSRSNEKSHWHCTYVWYLLRWDREHFCMSLHLCWIGCRGETAVFHWIERKFYPHFVRQWKHCRFRGGSFQRLDAFHRDFWRGKDHHENSSSVLLRNVVETNVISTFIATIRRWLYWVYNNSYVFWFSTSSISQRQRNAPYFENSTANERPKTPPDPVIRTISSLIDFFGAGKIEKTMARVNLRMNQMNDRGRTRIRTTNAMITR